MDTFNKQPGGAAADNKEMALNACKIGILMLLGWVIPLIGIPLWIIGLVCGIISYTSSRPDLAKAGIFLNGLGLGLTAINMLINFYLFVSGEINPLDLFNY